MKTCHSSESPHSPVFPSASTGSQIQAVLIMESGVHAEENWYSQEVSDSKLLHFEGSTHIMS